MKLIISVSLRLPAVLEGGGRDPSLPLGTSSAIPDFNALDNGVTACLRFARTPSRGGHGAMTQVLQ